MESQSNKKSIVCIFTPTYNRKTLLIQLYESLKRQSNPQFSWFIVDDGSTDETGRLVKKWQEEDNVFRIRYHYKENGGKHTALNYGFTKIREPLTFIVDSDDTLTEDAVESIVRVYKKIEKDTSVCGMAFLKGDRNGVCIGKKFKREGLGNWNHMRFRDLITGDKAEVWKTKYLSKYLFPVYENEKFMGEGYLWCQLSEKYGCYMENRIIYLCDYLEGGLTRSIGKLRIQNPRGGLAHAKVPLKKCYPLWCRIKNAILYDCYSFFLKNKIGKFTAESGYPLITTITAPAGWILYLYWRHKYG